MAVTMIQNVMDAIRGKKRQLETQKHSKRASLVIGIADGTVKDQAAAETMMDLGISEQELQDDLARLVRRRTLAKTIADANPAAAEIAKHSKLADEAQAERTRCHEKTEPIIRAANYWIADWEQKQQAAAAAENELMRTGTDPEILAEIAALQTQLSEFGQRDGQLRTMQRNTEEVVGVAERQWREHCQRGGVNKLPAEPRGLNPCMSASAPPEDFTATIKSHLESVRTKLADIIAEITQNRVEMELLNAKIETVRRKFLDPTL